LLLIHPSDATALCAAATAGYSTSTVASDLFAGWFSRSKRAVEVIQHYRLAVHFAIVRVQQVVASVTGPAKRPPTVPVQQDVTDVTVFR
jgi:hypothetical protein